jgi:hypothetical protein
MAPSAYFGCAINDDAIGDALREVNNTLKEIEDEGKAAIAALSAELDKISGTEKGYAEATLGTTINNQVLWKAKEPGRPGNDIKITYIYEGPEYPNITLTGALSVSNGVPNVAGVGTSFTTELKEQDSLRIVDSLNVPRAYRVVNIVSDISLVLADPYGGVTETGLDGFVDMRARAPSSLVVDKTVILSLAVATDGTVDPTYNTSATLTEWLTNSDVTDLVTAELVGAGTDLPEIVEFTSLSGGHGTPVKDAEEASNTIAKQFGQTTYQDLMKSIEVPVIETEADAAAYLESQDDEIIIINKKLFLVEGTNLIGIRQLYNILGNDLKKTKELMETMSKTLSLPHLAITQNVAFQDYETVCGEIVSVSVIREVFRAYNELLGSVAGTYANGDVSQLNGYIFWIESAKSTVSSYNKLRVWGYPDVLITDILDGATPTLGENDDYPGNVPIPVVATIEDPNLFSKLNLTDDEIEELLGKDVDGISVPSANDPSKKQAKLSTLLRNNREVLTNGMRSKVKKPLLAAQAIDLSATGDDENLSKEMATRGKGCARQIKNMRTSLTAPVSELVNTVTDKITKVPNYLDPSKAAANLDLPNIPSPDLPDVASKVESAFGAISSVVKTATKTFDRLIGGLMGAVKGVLNKLQNILSLADNLINNDLTQCLLGTSSAATGALTGESGGIPSPGGASSLTGGIPIPMSVLGDILRELSASLDEVITSAFESMTKIMEKPLCMVMSMLDDILGVDLGGLTNPCKDGKDPNEDCPPEDVQETINDSEELSTVYNKLPQSNVFPKVPDTTEITESVEDFTGDIKAASETTTQAITRGIREIMEDLTKSVESKMDVVNEFDTSIKQLLGEDSSELALNANESLLAQESCAPVSMGSLTDAIVGFI